jgi:hypothetical protein
MPKFNKSGFSDAKTKFNKYTVGVTLSSFWIWKPFYLKVKRVLNFKLKLAKTQILMTADVISYDCYVIIKNMERYNIYFINHEACSSTTV